MKVWLFDIDGTLIASGGAGQEATFAALSAAFGVPVTRAGIAFAGRTDRAIATDVFAVHGIRNTEENWQTFQRVYLDHLQLQLNRRAGEVLQGVRQLLRRLEEEPTNHLGLLTGNIRAGAERKLRHYGLWHHFYFGGYGDQHESRDDVARQALAAAREFLRQPVGPRDIWVVGDTVNDVRCARAIGAHVIAVATGGAAAEELAAAEPDLLLDHLAPSAALMALLG
jgi:phosphoglycolate phosphatase-like HAD superfamily hydrolase